MNKSVVASAVAAAFATGLFAAQFGLEKALVGETHAVPKTVAVDPSSPTGSSTPTLSGNLPDFSALVESQGPAVVNISVSKVVKNGVPNGMQGVPEDLQEFFRRFQPQPRGLSRGRRPRSRRGHRS